MGGFATYDKGGGVPGTTVYADNVDFTGTGRTNTITTNGQLLIGATAANAGGNHINVGTITSPGGTITVGFSSPNITIDLAGGGVAVDSFSPDTGTDPVVPTAAGLLNDKGSGSITTVGSLNTITTQLTGLTNHAVLVGAGTPTITKVGPSATNGAAFVAAGAAADPLFNTSFTIVNNTTAYLFSQSGGTTQFAVSNTSTGNNSPSQILVTSASNTGVSDAFIEFSLTGGGTGNAYAMGYQTSSGRLLIQNGKDDATGGLNGNTAWSLVGAGSTGSGSINLPLQPSFSAYVSANQTNVTGDGTDYTLIFDTVDLNQGSYYNAGTGVFTAPVAGNYLFTFNFTVFGMLVANNNANFFIRTGGGVTIATINCNPFATQAAAGTPTTAYSCSCVYPLTAAATVTCHAVVAGGTKVVGVAGGTPTRFSGQLLS